MNLQTIKNRYDIIGNDAKLILAIHKAVQVAPTDLSILVTGESGVGKDVFSRIIHDNSDRKHKKLVSVNCGAIPEGTIESELFGHIKGSFTGAEKDRKGYFEEADGGTIFLDEVGELPLAMQVKLLRVLENKEIIPVGSSQARRIDVRVVAATNVDILAAVRNGRFREDLYYRLNQISIEIPPLRERKEDIHLLFRKFSSDIAEKYHMPPIFLNEAARDYLTSYPWYGNIRELKNITEQMAVVETERTITLPILQQYIHYVPQDHMPAVVDGQQASQTVSDRELLLKALSMGQMINDMRSELNALRQAVTRLAQGMPIENMQVQNVEYAGVPLVHNGIQVLSGSPVAVVPDEKTHDNNENDTPSDFNDAVVVEDEPISLQDRERTAIRKALQRHKGKRRSAARELGISERTLYRKLKEYDIE